MLEELLSMIRSHDDDRSGAHLRLEGREHASDFTIDIGYFFFVEGMPAVNLCGGRHGNLTEVGWIGLARPKRRIVTAASFGRRIRIVWIHQVKVEKETIGLVCTKPADGSGSDFGRRGEYGVLRR